MTISVIIVGLPGLIMVIAGFGIMYLGHKSGRMKKQEFINNRSNIRRLLLIRRAGKIAGYFFGILTVLFGILWIVSTMTISVIIVGLPGLIMVIAGFSIIYWVYRWSYRLEAYKKQYFYLTKVLNLQVN